MRLLTHRRLRITALLLLITAAALAAVRYWPREPLSKQIATSIVIFDRDNQLLRLTLASDDQYRLWTRLEDISPDLVEALLLHEDRHFYSHPGINPLAVLRAVWATARHAPHQGGSTISMQLARLMYGLNTRNVRGKLMQMLRATQLELCYSKHDLLEAHLNLLPYGRNVQGVGAASLIYFNKTAKQLSLPEALSLVLIPQSPARRAPNAAEPLALTQARLRLFARWQAAHPDSLDTTQTMAQSLPYSHLGRLPFAAPHFVDALLQQPSTATTLSSTLDIHQQRLLERVLRQYVRGRASMGIHNASAMLVDARDMSVRVVVGSADFFNAAIGGQVNGTLAKRSPGSALKPFIYALAIDQGIIHPQSVLKDAPSYFGTFSPENFDGRFAGPIAATQALIRSRNVPAVALASQLSNPSLYQFLHSAGISQLKSEHHYGLSLALGGSETTMEELAMLYTMLANRGQLRPLRYLRDAATSHGTTLLSEDASYMVLDMLKQNQRPDDTPSSMPPPVQIAWKTGTSWGFRDAWTAGVFGPYVLVVWVGNFDGSGNPAFVGVQAAAPLFFRMVDALLSREPNLHELNYRMPPRMKQVDVCAASGDLPNAACPQTIKTWYIPGVSPIKLSTLHRRVIIETRTGKVACQPYDLRHTRSEIFEYWPSDLAQLFKQAGMPRRPAPENRCNETVQDSADATPTITSPLTNSVYTLRRQNPQAIPFAANVSADSHTVYWFVDSSYVGNSAAGIALGWTPDHAGNYTVLAVDDQGRTMSRSLSVEWVN